jgi:RNase P subunit RPR2
LIWRILKKEFKGTPLPQKINCKNCKKILYEGKEIESPSEIIRKNNGLCPSCKGKLNFKIENVKIIPISDNN